MRRPGLQLLQADAQQFGGPPVGEQHVAAGVQQQYPGLQVVDQAAVAVLAVAQRSLDTVLVERHLEHDAQFALGIGLEHITEGLGELGAFQRGILGKGRQEDHRNGETVADLGRRVDAIHGASQLDVHQHQIGTQFTGQQHGLLATLGMGHRLVAEAGELQLDVACHDGLVFDDKDAWPGGGVAHDGGVSLTKWVSGAPS